MQEVQVGVHNFRLEVTLANIGKAPYPKLYVDFTVTITPAICDCTMLTWDKPAAQSLSTTVLVQPSPTLTIVSALANAASKLAHPAIRMCYQPGQIACSETTAITSVVLKNTSALPVFVTRSDNVLTIAGTVNSQASGTPYVLTTIMSTPNSGDITWETITITMAICVIASIDTPTNPGT